MSDNQDNVGKKQKPDLRLPLVALVLSFWPFVFHGFSFNVYIPELILILSPVAGLITGVYALMQGKRRIGTLGKVIALVAIILPGLVIAVLIVLLIGASTGMVRMM